MDDAVVASVLGAQYVGFEERRGFASRLGLDAVCLHPRLSPTAGPGLPTAKDVEWPDLGLWDRESDRFVFALMDGAFGWGSRLIGLENLLVAPYRNALELVKFVRQVEDLNVALIERAVAAGATGIVVADDFAYQRGPFFSPSLMRSLFFPSLARQAEVAHGAGVPIFLHADGNLDLVLHDLVEAGLDGLQAVESAAGMELRSVKERFGQHLCLWGNLDPRFLVHPHADGQLRQAAEAITALADPEGGLIFGTSSGLFAGMSTESILALYPLE